tara:strand:- start:1777 stop:2220 length:444 start_codon:yes stop_codon:yes gene_type:complete
MATTTASLTITSTDLFDDSLSISNTSTCYKAGTTIGLDQTTGLTRTYVTATQQFDPFPVVKGATNADENGKVYISNLSEDETEYIIVGIGDLVIGRLYAGDFMWMPWSPKAQHVNDIEITPSVATGMHVEFMAIHNFANIYPNSADS